MVSTTISGAILSLLAMGSVAYAQDAAAPEPEAQEAEVTEVTVVGSRIRKDTYNSASPIQVITRNESTMAGLSSTSAILQSTAVTGGGAQINNAFGGLVTNGGPGANTVGLRGLGPGRTLVLINGRRVAPAGSRGSVGSADLNVLPNALINRVDVLRDGASAIYGSDAIGGVINVVTRNVQGVSLEAQYNKPVDGGGEQSRVAFIAGKTWDRFSAQGSFEYYESEELKYGDRDWMSCQTDGTFNKTTGAITDYIDPLTGKSKCYTITNQGSNAGVTINTLGTPGFAGVPATGAPTIATYNRWRPNSAVSTGLTGFEGVSGGSLNVRDTFDPDLLNNSLLSPVKVYTGFFQTSYDLSEYWNSEFYTEVLVNRRVSSQTNNRQLSLDYAVGSPLIPANIAAIPGNFLPAGGTVLFAGPTKARAFIGYGNYESRQEVDFAKFTAGFKGDFALMDGWRYDATLQYSKSDASYMFESWLTDRVAASLNVATPVAGVPAHLIRPGANGAPVTCASNNANPSAASCVPAPVLNANTIGGILPEDWKAYTFVPVESRTLYEETTFTADINGPLFTLPAGDLMAAFGVEYRKASIDDQPNENSVSGNLYNLTSAAPTVGEDSVMEAFVEFQIPVLKDLPFAKNLSLELAGRYTDYDSYGDDTTYKAGIMYQPFDFLTLRASKGTSYRAPALFEQFLGGTTSFAASTGDPCNNWDSPGVDANRRANCQSLGLPAGWGVGSGNNQSIQIVQAGGASQGLVAETSDNLTVGAILQANFLPEDVFGNLSLAVDYFDIEINDGVARAGQTFILNQCYNSPNFSSPYCAYTARTPVTNALTVFDSYTNVSAQTVKGYDYNLRWNRDIGKVDVLVNLAITKFNEQGIQPRPGAALVDYNGTLSTPDYTGELTANFTWDQWRVTYGVDWVGEMQSYDLYGINPATSTLYLETPNYFLHRASVQYKTDDWTATVGMRNIENELPPFVSTHPLVNRVGNSPLYSSYDYKGREVFVSFTKSF
nr:TonB-dependent receptor [Asticcacaulis machinosus]